MRAPDLLAARPASAVFHRSQNRSRPNHIRASQAPLVADSAEITSRSPADAHRGRLQIVGTGGENFDPVSTEAPASGQACRQQSWRDQKFTVAQTERIEHVRVATGTRGLTITHGITGRLSGSSPADAGHVAAREARQTGTSAPVRSAPRAAVVSAGKSLSCANSAAPPPRRPNRRRRRRGRQDLFSVK